MGMFVDASVSPSTMALLCCADPGQLKRRPGIHPGAADTRPASCSGPTASTGSAGEEDRHQDHPALRGSPGPARPRRVDRGDLPQPAPGHPDRPPLRARQHPEELLAKTGERASVLDGFTAYLHQRWNQGCTDAAVLTKELKAQGYTGSDQTVRRYLRPFRHGRPAPPPGPTPPTVREVTGWILRRPDTLEPEEQTRFKEVLARCPHLDAASGHVAAFAEMLTGLHGDRLDGWIAAVDAADLPGLHSFTTGLRRDHKAVVNGLTLPYSSGAVEGNVNRIKMLKRQMYGRANLDLLRKRVVLTT